MQLSNRLNHVMAMVSETDCGADVGCDHGFVSIELVERGIARRMIAMDLREGPLSRAREHVAERGLESRIELRLSDGVKALKVGEADAMVVAGMGGNLVIHILEEGRGQIAAMKQCILQPQSELAKVRRYLREQGYRTLQEDMVFEDGKYYPMMKVVPGMPGDGGENPSSQLFDSFGEGLLRERNEVLKQFLLHRMQCLKDILQVLSREEHAGRREEIRAELQLVSEALDFYG